MKKAVKWGSMFLLALMLAIGTVSFVSYATEDNASAQTESSEDVAIDTEDSGSNVIGSKALAVGLAIGMAAAGGAIGMGILGGKSVEGMSRQPEAQGPIRTTMMLGLVFIETAVIYALLVVILVIFVL